MPVEVLAAQVLFEPMRSMKARATDLVAQPFGAGLLIETTTDYGNAQLSQKIPSRVQTSKTRKDTPVTRKDTPVRSHQKALCYLA